MQILSGRNLSVRYGRPLSNVSEVSLLDQRLGGLPDLATGTDIEFCFGVERLFKLNLLSVA